MEEKMTTGFQPTQGTTVDFHSVEAGCNSSLTTDTLYSQETNVKEAAARLIESAKALRGIADRAKAIYVEAETEALKAETAAEMAMLGLIFGEEDEDA